MCIVSPYLPFVVLIVGGSTANIVSPYQFRQVLSRQCKRSASEADLIESVDEDWLRKWGVQLQTDDEWLESWCAPPLRSFEMAAADVAMHDQPPSET
eukprot:7140596-Pyramimonas_sp.AAC.1